MRFPWGFENRLAYSATCPDLWRSWGEGKEGGEKSQGHMGSRGGVPGRKSYKDVPINSTLESRKEGGGGRTGGTPEKGGQPLKLSEMYKEQFGYLGGVINNKKPN